MNNIYKKKISECPLCKSQKIWRQYTINKFNPSFDIDKCYVCGFMFMNPRFSDAYIKDIYNENYYTGKAEYSYYDERDAERYSQYVWKKRIKKIRQYVSEGNFLDIGCAFGGFLKTASEFFTPYGIEFSEYSAKQAKTVFGKSIHLGTLEKHSFRNNFFSVITMIELIEHLSDPQSAVSECYKLLENDGLLVIQTANMNGLQAKILKENYGYFLPGHISYFTKENLTGLLIKAGFKKIKVFYPVEFGLLPKLLKSRYNFKSKLQYLKWFRIGYYHYISKIHFGNFAATSSMVVFAFK
jgi:2-polyprenyl-3-methyl-5-hydroxy-6-metoxy-1,4-benzoquinol methylase